MDGALALGACRGKLQGLPPYSVVQGFSCLLPFPKSLSTFLFCLLSFLFLLSMPSGGSSFDENVVLFKNFSRLYLSNSSLQINNRSVQFKGSSLVSLHVFLLLIVYSYAAPLKTFLFQISWNCNSQEK